MGSLERGAWQIEGVEERRCCSDEAREGCGERERVGVWRAATPHRYSQKMLPF